MNRDVEILKALRVASREGVSGAELAEVLGISRAAVWERIAELRRLGYGIEASPHRGYCLVSVPDVLHADDLMSRLGSVRVIGRDIRIFRQTTSTNDVADKLARDGVPEGMTVFAESQTRGRGRLGRGWFSPAGKGLWFSVLLRPRVRPAAVTQLTVAASNALCRAIEQVTTLVPEIKWPNDILVRGRKVAGLLTELHAELDQVRYAILGVGVNVNQVTADFPEELRKSATSLRIAQGAPVERAALAAAVLAELDLEYARISRGQFEAVADEWEARCSTLGREVTIQAGGRRIRGQAETVDAEGALLVRTEHGHLERVTGGDVTIERTRSG